MDSVITVIAPEAMTPALLSKTFSCLKSADFHYHAVFRMGRYATMETVLRCLKAARDLPVTIEANGLLVSSSLCSVLRDAHAKVVFLQDGYPNSTTLFANSLVLKEMGMDATFRASLDEERAETLVPWMWLDTLSNAGFTSFEYTCQPTLSPFLFRSFLSALFSYWHAEKPVEVKVPQLDAFSTIVQGGRPPRCVYRGVCDIQYAVDGDGSVYPCPLYAGNAGYRLGNVAEDTKRSLDRKRRESGFINQSLVHGQACQACPFEKWCHTGCQAQRSPVTGQLYRCASYKGLFARYRKTFPAQ